MAVVTGGSGGVGRAAVRRFARQGTAVGIVARGREGIDAAVREVRALGVPAEGVSADVADPDAVEAAAARFDHALGPVDVWVNCAAVAVFAPVADLAPAEARRVMEVTYGGTVHGTQAALRRMLPRDRGVIVQCGSPLAIASIPLLASYCAAKHAIQGFTEALRSELKHDRSGVRVTTVHVPSLNTPLYDHARSRLPRRPKPVVPRYTPDVAARAIVWAAEHPRREVWVGETTAAAIIGHRLSPVLVERYFALAGYRTQMTSEPDGGGRPDNLFEPLPGDPGAEGRQHRALSASAVAWVARHRLAVAAAVVAAAAPPAVRATVRFTRR